MTGAVVVVADMSLAMVSVFFNLVVITSIRRKEEIISVTFNLVIKTFTLDLTLAGNAFRNKLTSQYNCYNSHCHDAFIFKVKRFFSKCLNFMSL